MKTTSFLLVDSFYPINTRNVKIAESIEKLYNKSKVDIVAWNRENRKIQDKHQNYHIYNKYSPAGKLFLKLINLYYFAKFVKNINNELKSKILIASHWEVLFLLSLFKRKEQILIYENLDIPTARYSFVLKILQHIEKIALKKTDAIFFASRFFYPLYDFYKGEKFILENKPIKNIVHNKICRCRNTDFVISYIGNVRYLPIMKNLIDAVKDIHYIKLMIHGDGASLNDLKEYSKHCTNVYFTGRYEVEKLPQLYENTDIVWAVYPNDDYNVKYAISNKFHESLMYHKPCIYANRTELGDYVENNSLGWTVNPYCSKSIKELITSIYNNPTILFNIKKNLEQEFSKAKTWEEDLQPIISYINKIKD